ncbi:MAG TPA: hypothetical protein ENH88_14965 [Pseudoalteromonas prydzensis]|nr:hypothetical protein [Pseudoalteromonas prydzensis]HEA17709.1 hypothetical protein [Pseudoalteromonas prydzensis]
MNMLDIIAKYKKEDDIKKESNFYSSCDMLVFLSIEGFNRTLNLSSYMSLCDDILHELKSFKSINREVKKIYFFQSDICNSDMTREIVPAMSMLEYMYLFHKDKLALHNEFLGYHYTYFIIEYKEKTNEGRLVHLLEQSLLKVYESFKVKNMYLNSVLDKGATDYHGHYQGIFDSYGLEGKKAAKPEIIEVPNVIEKPKKSSSVNEFIAYVDKSLKSIHVGQLPFHPVKFLMQDTREYKYLREEFVILARYIKDIRKSYDGQIELGEEKERWDAKIDSELIEITQAIPKYEYETRKALAFTIHQYRGLSLDLRTKHQQGVDSFSKVIVSSINAKHDKEYSEPRVLLIGALFEFFNNDELILAKSIQYVKENTILGIFSSIYIIVDSKRCIKIH